MTVQNWDKPLPEGWSGGEPRTKWYRGQMVHLYTVRRACAQCTRTMELDVTAAALEGKAKNAGLQLKRCPDCRAASKGGSSRPKAVGPMPVATEVVEVVTVDSPEVIALRMTTQTMKEELEGLYETVRELRNQLAQYELSGAMRAQNEKRTEKLPWM